MITSSLTQVDFQRKLNELFQLGQSQSLREIEIKAGDLHRLVGVYPQPNHSMPVCCQVMRKNMQASDQIISAPPKGNGASLTILYKLPR
jgi:hypothetical protein